jgi:chromosome segregation ATPase
MVISNEISLLRSHINKLKGRVEELEKIIDSLRSELAKEKQSNSNTQWVEHDDKSLRL